MTRCACGHEQIAHAHGRGMCDGEGEGPACPCLGYSKRFVIYQGTGQLTNEDAEQQLREATGAWSAEAGQAYQAEPTYHSTRHTHDANRYWGADFAGPGSDKSGQT